VIRALDAVIFCLTKKSSAEDAVAAYDADTACKTYEDVTAFSAQLEVP
jgi:hypothetical protein